MWSAACSSVSRTAAPIVRKLQEIIAEHAPSVVEHYALSVCYDFAAGTSVELLEQVEIQMQRIGRVTRGVVCAAGVVLFGLLVAGPAGAQLLKVDAWEDTGYISINFGYQVGDRTFQESLSIPIYDETATYSVDYASDGGGQLDIGAGVRVWRNLAAGVAVTRLRTSSGARVNGAVPNPLFFNRPRPGSLTLTDLDHSELGIHFQAVWVMPITEQISVAVAGGPSFLRVDQSLITGVMLGAEVPPFDTVALSAVTSSTVSKSGVGGNAGVDITYRVTEYFGGGVFARWSGGNVDFPVSGGTRPLYVGGFQSGIGLRVRF